MPTLYHFFWPLSTLYQFILFTTFVSVNLSTLNLSPHLYACLPFTTFSVCEYLPFTSSVCMRAYPLPPFLYVNLSTLYQMHTSLALILYLLLCLHLMVILMCVFCLPADADSGGLANALGEGLGGLAEGLGGLGMDDIDLQLKLLAMLDNPAVIVAAAAAGKADIIKDYLTRRPKDVCAHTHTLR